MSSSNAEKNKAIVLEAFDTLFNKRDYMAAERFWSANYIQHSALIEPGRDGLFNLIKAGPPSLKYEPGVILAEDDYVIVHGRFSNIGLPVNWIAADIVRLEDGILVEHWDVIQDEATQQQSRSGNPMFGDSFPTGRSGEPQFPSQADRELYTLYRTQVTAEDNLTNVRMTWLILLQGILLALLAGAVYQNPNQGLLHVIHLRLLKWLFCLGGLAGSIVILVGIHAAQLQIRSLRKKYYEIYGGKHNVPANLPGVVGECLLEIPGKRFGVSVHKLGQLGPYTIPILCILTWIGIGIYTEVSSSSPHFHW